jgi:hypothetical protein
LIFVESFSETLREETIDKDYFIPWRAVFAFDTIPGREHLLVRDYYVLSMVF